MWSSIVLSFKSQVLQRPFHHWIPDGSQAAVCSKYSSQGIRSPQILTSLSAVSEAPPITGSQLLGVRSGALQIQRLEGSRPAGLWDLYLDGSVLIVCEFAACG